MTCASLHPGRPPGGELHLILFTRFPEPGTVKTRLIPSLGPAGASDLQARMTENVFNWAKDLMSKLPVTLTVAYEGEGEDQFRKWLGDGVIYHPQCPGDLGKRMVEAIEGAFSRGGQTAILVGTDIPNLTSRVLETAFEILKEKDIVLGPATDGGYYLFGVRKRECLPWQKLCSGIAWGTSRVLSLTLEKADFLRISHSLTPLLSDVDQPADLPVWATRSRKYIPKGSIPRISVIIPTLNEAGFLEKTLWSTLPMDHTETIVVDGGSRDGTIDIAKRYGVRVLKDPVGRAHQLNAGARAATGAIFIFLHGDTRLPPDAGSRVRTALRDPSVAAGAFSIASDVGGCGFRLVEKGAHFRSRCLGHPYGDQAIFMRRRTFERLGGFSGIPIMEDFVMMKRARRLGRIVLLPEAVITSARRWQRLGVVRTTLINQLMLFGYAVGLSPSYLSRIYRKPRW